MKDTWEIVFGGVGGQGLVSCGSILGEAASLEGLNVAMTTSYGVETRGTFAKSDLIISKDEIDFPEAQTPGVVLALAQEAYRRYAPDAEPGTIIIYDEQSVIPQQSAARQYGYPIQETARRMKNPASANILSLGIILGKTGLLKTESVRRAIEKAFAKNPRAVEQNQQMLECGVKMASSERPAG